jgi:hypothetical protein
MNKERAINKEYYFCGKHKYAELHPDGCTCISVNPIDPCLCTIYKINSMNMKKDLFPSLKEEPEDPKGWIQWKGTDSCIDLYCKCGFHGHLDTDFMYHVKCPECGQVYECSGFIKLIPLDFEPEGTKEIEN